MINNENSVGILNTAEHWKKHLDLKRRAIFPKEIFATNQQPAIIESTVPWEERIEEAHERKRLKYEELTAECRERKWKSWSLPLEVGCRGFACQSLWNMAKMLNMCTSWKTGRDGIYVLIEEDKWRLGEWVTSSRLSLINSVGAPSEVVMEVLKQPRKKNTTSRWYWRVYRRFIM
jgi:hypothetical protein